jgi:glycine betaine/proline transport system substrate-binding protein
MTLIKRLWTVAASAVFAFAVMSSDRATAQSIPESDDPIVLALNDWTGQFLTTYIAGELLKKMGYNVEYVTVGATAQFEAIKDGELDAQLEVWTSSASEAYDEAVASGKAVSLGSLGLVPREAWYYPSYIEDDCPGLPEWTALNDCIDLFSSPDTYPSGRLVDYPPEWEAKTAEKISALQLDYVPVPSGGEGALVAEIESAFAREAPLLVVFWEPHWIFIDHDMNYVHLPDYDPACETDPSWGPNPNATGDCERSNHPVYKLVWAGMEEKWPAAYRFLQSFELTNADQIVMIRDVDVDGQPIEEVVSRWINDNEATWSTWMDSAQM